MVADVEPPAAAEKCKPSPICVAFTLIGLSETRAINFSMTLPIFDRWRICRFQFTIGFIRVRGGKFTLFVSSFANFVDTTGFELLSSLVVQSIFSSPSMSDAVVPVVFRSHFTFGLSTMSSVAFLLFDVLSFMVSSDFVLLLGSLLLVLLLSLDSFRSNLIFGDGVFDVKRFTYCTTVEWFVNV